MFEKHISACFPCTDNVIAQLTVFECEINAVYLCQLIDKGRALCTTSINANLALIDVKPCINRHRMCCI